ncbi:hypothetical protein SNE40_017124 [Patella caerulea]|uniref:Uncharacterized protein n=1 Tax=Patella caerulea TaxID=87958 RepID=A0AAN8JEE0_PATCE
MSQIDSRPGRAKAGNRLTKDPEVWKERSDGSESENENSDAMSVDQQRRDATLAVGSTNDLDNLRGNLVTYDLSATKGPSVSNNRLIKQTDYWHYN